MGSLVGLTHLRAGHEGAGLEPDKQQDDPSLKGEQLQGFYHKATAQSSQVWMVLVCLY